MMSLMLARKTADRRTAFCSIRRTGSSFRRVALRSELLRERLLAPPRRSPSLLERRSPGSPERRLLAPPTRAPSLLERLRRATEVSGSEALPCASPSATMSETTASRRRAARQVAELDLISRSLLHPPLRDTESPSVDYVHQGMSRPVASPGGGRRRAGLSLHAARDRRSGGGAQVGAPLQFMDGLEDLVGVAEDGSLRDLLGVVSDERARGQRGASVAGAVVLRRAARAPLISRGLASRVTSPRLRWRSCARCCSARRSRACAAR